MYQPIYNFNILIAGLLVFVLIMLPAMHSHAEEVASSSEEAAVSETETASAEHEETDGSTSADTAEADDETAEEEAATEETAEEESEATEAKASSTPAEDTENDAEADTTEETIATSSESAQSPADDTEVSTSTASSSDAVPKTETASSTESATNTGGGSSGGNSPAPVGTTTASSSPEISLTATTTSTTTETIGSPATTTATTTPKATTTITTGDAIATANVVNVANSNFVNSNGSIVVYDILSGEFAEIDLRSASSGCSLSNCGLSGFSVNLSNDAFIDNALILGAQSGSNTIDGADAAVIKTGDAYTNANLINVANLNLVNSQYLLAIINAFASVQGNIVFPSLQAYLTSQTTPNAITLNNDGTIENNVALGTNSGQNTLDDVTYGTINTGSTNTSLGLINQLNSSLIGGQNVSLLLRVHGNWTGEVYGLPDGIEMIGVDGGYILNFSKDGGAAFTTPGSVSATNTAMIRNNVSLWSDTGNNSIANADSALISTGDAYAGANIINVANGNVIGRNWMLGIINIFGDFSGNIEFGRPDLWVGATVGVPNRVYNGDTVTYQYTITNRGDARASNVTLTDTISQYVSPTELGGASYDATTHTLSQNLGTLEPGQTKIVTYEATVMNAAFDTDVTNRITVAERETDNDLKDNTEIVTFVTRSSGSGSKTTEKNKSLSNVDAVAKTPLTPTLAGLTDLLRIEREPLTSVVVPGEKVTQTLRLTNPSDQSIPNVHFTDTLYKRGTNSVVSSETWQLGTIAPHEEILLTYDLSFSSVAPRGEYYFVTNVANTFGTLSETYNGKLFLVAAADTEVTKQAFTPALPLAAVTIVRGVSTSTATHETASGVSSLFPVALASGELSPTPAALAYLRPLVELMVALLLGYAVHQMVRRRYRIRHQ